MSIYFQRNFQRIFGTFPLRGDACREAITTAAQVGYRAFDTAQYYENEADVGAALNATGINRADLCITTKVRNDNYTAELFLASVEKSLATLQVDYVDVLLLHWPPADFNIGPPLELLMHARDKGYAKHIGVSNFTAQMMRDAKQIVNSPIAINQVEFHPLLNQSTLLGATAETGIALSAYCSVARGEVFNYPQFETIASAYGKSAAQVVQRWILQKGVAVNTMSTRRENIEKNYDVMDFTLSSVDMAAIDQ
ncbi:MAG: aldo/keto reductase, partial [Granulosicoccus sp.]